MKKYDPKKIEKKWQEFWDKKKINKTDNKSDQPKYYILDMFPYPSGAGLHVGHPKGYIATDVVARMKMMQGYNVLHPMGWDAFGLPAENYAIANKVHPKVATYKNIATFKKQLGKIGFTYDWSREINTTDPEYYRWTQWTFLQMFQKGLAYESFEPVNWCPVDKTVLANEDLENGCCERCGSPVERRPMRQWVLRITKYADRMLNDLDKLPKWPEAIKEMQRNWIGRSEGAQIKFPLAEKDKFIEVFTTRPDTLFGVTYVVLAPENKLVDELKNKINNWPEVEKYLNEAKKKSDLERTELQKEKTGVKLDGVFVMHPITREKIPVWIADYVLASYGTGAVMAVPAHDERDYEFAKRYNLPIKEVIQPLVTREKGEDGFRRNIPVNERHAVVAVIKHWSEDKYLGVEWKKTGWKGFVIGGIENGEKAADAGVREIVEESGYKNVKFVRPLGGIVHAQFYQMVKNHNRLAHFEPALFQLEDGEMVETSDEEKNLHEFKWLKPEEFSSYITHPDMQIVWDRLQGNYCYGGNEKIDGFSLDGILTASSEFDGLAIAEAK